MNVSQAESIVDSALKGRLLPLTVNTLRNAIVVALQEMVRKTEVTKTSGVVQLTTNDETVNVAAALDDFRPEYHIYSRIGYNRPLQLVDFRYIASRLYDGTNSVTSTTGIPTMVAFETPQSGFLFPVPDDEYELTVVYKAALNDLTNDDAEINIPDEHLYPALYFGASAVCEHNIPDVLYQSVAWKRYTEEILPSIAAAVAVKGVMQIPPVYD